MRTQDEIIVKMTKYIMKAVRGSDEIENTYFLNTAKALGWVLDIDSQMIERTYNRLIDEIYGGDEE